MNYFYDLPDDLLEKIIYIRDNNMAKKIQNLWVRYCQTFNALMLLTHNCYYYDEYFTPTIEISTKRTAEIIEFIDKKIHRQNRVMYYCSNEWHELLNDINDGLILEQYNGGATAVYYNRVEKAFYNIITKLDMKHLFDNEPEYFMYM